MIYVCNKIPLRHGEPLPFKVGVRYSFAQIGRVFVYYRPHTDGYRETDIKIGYKQFRECFKEYIGSMIICSNPVRDENFFVRMFLDECKNKFKPIEIKWYGEDCKNQSSDSGQ